MQLLALDNSFNPLKYIQFINLQWTRQYYEIGEFSVQMLASEYSADMAYLYTPDRPEVGIIQKVELTDTIKGSYIQASGLFLEALLNDKVVYPTFYGTGALDTAVMGMISQYKDDIPLLSVATPSLALSATAWQETGGQLGTVAYSQLQTAGASIRCRFDYSANKIICEAWQGLDRTQSQTVNNFVTFSRGFRNLSEIKASVDSSNYKNYAIVGGTGDGDDRKVAYVDQSNGGYKKQLFVDCKSMSYNSEKQTEAEYLESLQQKGVEKLLKYQTIKNIEVDVSQGSFEYLADFDIGDKVDVIIDELGLSIEARIITAREVFKQNMHTVTVELGDQLLTILDKARLIS